MAYLCLGKDELFATWAAKRIEGSENETAEQSFGQYKAVGIMTGPTKKDRLLGVVVFHNWVPKYRTVEASMAACDPHWASKSTIRSVLSIPFLQYDATKVWTVTDYREDRVIRLNKAMGFRQEGILRNQLGVDEKGKGIHAVICGMLKSEYLKKYPALVVKEEQFA